MYNEVITLKYIKLHNLQIPHIKNIESLYKEIDLIANKIMDYTIP